jgi:glycosyltransferase involved in cell wall biosynthesis
MTVKPHVSIGMPVYNGANFMHEAIDSILNQTYKDFELIISDNASDDRTQEICDYYASKDDRVRYYRNEENIGAARNYNKTFHLARGTYFKWMAHDDAMAPEYLKEAVKVLDANPGIIAVQSEVKVIDEKGKVIELYKNYLVNIGSSNPAVRYGDFLLADHGCFDVFSLMRKEVLGKTKLHGSHLAADRNLLGELALRGKFYKIPQYLFYVREHPSRSIRIGPQTPESRGKWFDSRNNGKRMYEHPRLFLEYWKAIQRVPLSFNERAQAYKYLWRWFVVSKNSIKNDFIHYNPFLNFLFRQYQVLKSFKRKKVGLTDKNL